MKKLFTLIAVAAMTLAANAADKTTPVTYTFDNQAATYKLGDNCEATTAKLDDVDGFAVNYTGAASDNKMQVKLAANENIFFEYSNSSTKSTIVKTAPTFFVCNGSGFVLNVPVVAGDVVCLKYSAKGSTAAEVDLYGTNPAEAADADAVKTCSGTTAAEAVIFKVTATKGGTFKIKETKGGMRVYAISINQTPTAISEVSANAAAAPAVIKTANGIIKNGVKYNYAGQQVK